MKIAPSTFSYDHVAEENISYCKIKHRNTYSERNQAMLNFEVIKEGISKYNKMNAQGTQ